MMTSNPQFIVTLNAYLNANQGTLERFGSNLPYGAVSAEEFNTKIGSSLEMVQHVNQASEEEPAPLFGTHIREAASTLKKIFR